MKRNKKYVLSVKDTTCTIIILAGTYKMDNENLKLYDQMFFIFRPQPG